MKSKTCCFTGHRDILAKDVSDVKAKTEIEIVKLIEQGVIYFGAGGARGFDTLAAETVINLKRLYPQIKLILILPCNQQTKGWTKADQEKYEQIKSQADKIRVLSEHYFAGCMHKRNRHMVDHSGYCICYCKKDTGGTAYTVNYAKAKNVNIIYI